jgi:hypothetical protein
MPDPDPAPPDKPPVLPSSPYPHGNGGGTQK